MALIDDRQVTPALVSCLASLSCLLLVGLSHVVEQDQELIGPSLALSLRKARYSSL